MDVVFESIFPLQKGPTLLLLVSTWADLPIAEEAVVADMVNAEVEEEVTVTMMMDTAGAMEDAHGVVAVMAGEVAVHPLLITEVVHEGTFAHGQDLTHLVAIESL